MTAPTAWLPRWVGLRCAFGGQSRSCLPRQGPLLVQVPLVDYHGGGPAAAFDPMSKHLPEFEMALAQVCCPLHPDEY